MASSSGQTQSTAKFSDGHIGRILDAEHARAYQDLSLSSALGRLPYRISILPVDPSAFRSGSQQLQSPVAHSALGAGRTRCFNVLQGQADASYIINEPFHCEIFYHPNEDSAVVQNQDHTQQLEIAKVTRSGINEQKRQSITLKRSEKLRIFPGTWSFRGTSKAGTAFHLNLYPRTYSLAILQSDDLTSAAGFKRTYGNDKNKQGAAVGRKSNASSVTRKINSLSDLGPSDRIVQVAQRGKEEYQLRLENGKLYDGHLSTIWTARHTRHPGEAIVVKLVKHENPVSRAKMWKKEAGLLQLLKSDKIVKFLGADARLSVLFLERIKASDLASAAWLRKDQMFGGNHQDATRILRDMAQALEHLRLHNIVHHDVKPPNILYSKGVGAVLIDFGLATKDDSEVFAGGSPWYTPPEYADRRPERQAPEDVWALGVVMIYLLGLNTLPELGQQVAAWNISAILDKCAAARASMEKWIRIVLGVAKKLLGSQNPLHVVVGKMLDPNPRNRISPAQISSAIRAMPSQSSTA